MPSLPPELWRAVLQELADMPGTPQKGYEPFSIEDHLDYHEPTAEMQAWKQDLGNIALVCKTWRRVALPMLYKILHIDSESGARGICEALSAPVDDDDDFPGRGDFVRQIYISMPWSPRQVTDEASQDFTVLGGHIAHIIERCPHLSIFTYRMFPTPLILRPAFDAILASSAAGRLLKLDIGYHIYQIYWPPTLWELVLETIGHLPCLETLILTSAINDIDGSAILYTPAHAIHTPHLKTLIVPWSVYQLMLAGRTQLNMPELQEIHIMGVSISDTTSEVLAHHPSVETDQLNGKVVSIGVSRPRTWASDDFSDYWTFLAHFPNLRSAHLVVEVIMSGPDWPLEHPSLTCIAIVQNRDLLMERRISPRRIVMGVEPGIEAVFAGCFPKLQKVQIAGYYAEFWKKEAERVAIWDQKLRARGVALELCRAYL
ncbi:hypothetical protein DENSPDRAFT_830691 [Dentipellis sp. KUC8613]|nr:hypothetical protein DENSPDRAFT_830691 [Dentipellis sp. KUC8613]